jgi:hypothetical protein
LEEYMTIFFVMVGRLKIGNGLLNVIIAK